MDRMQNTDGIQVPGYLDRTVSTIVKNLIIFFENCHLWALAWGEREPAGSKIVKIFLKFVNYLLDRL